MATTRPRKAAPHKRDDGGIRWLTPEEGLELFDREAHRYLGISGEEFLRRWDAGEYDAIFEDPAHHSTLVHLWMMIPFAR